jgi:hypothetical protein
MMRVCHESVCGGLGTRGSEQRRSETRFEKGGLTMKKSWMCVAMLAMAALVLGAGTAGAGVIATIADSRTEFSSTQGQDNWYYYYWVESGNYNPANVVAMKYWTGWGGRWTEDGTQPGDGGTDWTQHIFEGTIQANNAGSKWPVRRWLSEVGGTVNISGYFGELPTGYGGNGLTARIYVEGSQVWSGDLNTSPQTVNLTLMCL